MDEGEGVGGGGDSGEQFHRNEAISAVTDEAFVEEDDDYEDLYNDVNVGEGFFQSLKKNEELGFRNEDEARAEPQQPPPPRPPSMPDTPASSIPGVGIAEGERKFEEDVGMAIGSGSIPGRVDAYQSQGFRGNDMGMKAPVQPNGSLGLGPGSAPPATGRGYGAGTGGLRVELGPQSSKVIEVEEQAINNSMAAQGMVQPQKPHGMNVGTVGNEAMVRPGGAGGMNGTGGPIVGPGSAAVQVTPMVSGVAGTGGPGGGGGGGGGTILFVGDLHWWTTDAELEAELVKYGPVKEVKFFDEKASGKSKGYCQVEFYDPAAATACKDGMNGHVFNGRPCVVAFASPHTVKRMGEAQVNRNQQMVTQNQWQGRRGPNEATNNRPAGNNITTGGNYQGGDQTRNFIRGGNWGRGNPQGMGGRGPVGPIRNRPGGMAGRGIMGNGGNGFGQGMGPTPPLMPPQAMMGQGFDPTFGGPMGRMGNFGGFPGAPTPPFQGLLSSFPPVGNVGLPGIAPHVNPAFFGRGMPMNGMGMMPNAGIDGPNMGMWSDPNMGGWVGDEHVGRAGGESSYGEEAVSDHQYGEASERGGWQNPMKDKDRASERDFSGSSDRRYRDDREPGYDKDVPREKDTGHDNEWSEKRHREDRDTRERERERSRDRDRERERDRERSRDRDRDRERDRDRYKEDRDRYSDHHRYRDREAEYDDEWERGRSSRTHSKSRVSQEEERPRSRDADYGKRRRITSE